MRTKLLHLIFIKSRASDDLAFEINALTYTIFSVLNGNQDHGKIMMLSMIYMNLRCNDAADAFCKNIPVRRQCGRIYLVFSLDCWGSGGLGALYHEFNVD